MTIGTLTISGKRFVVVPEAEYERLNDRRGKSAGPSLPPPDADDHVPAIAYARISLARKVIAGRKRAGWSQAELARRSGIRLETVNRIENGKNTPDEKTLTKIAKALKVVDVLI